MIYFIHPDLKKREENFGGVIQTDKGLFVLNQTEFSFLKDFKTGPCEAKKTPLKKFLKINAICGISDEEISSIN